MAKRPYITADVAERHRQKADYCAQQAAIHRFKGENAEAKQYDDMAKAQTELAIAAQKRKNGHD